MDVYASCGGTENHPRYQQFEAENTARYYSFLGTVVRAALDEDGSRAPSLLSHSFIKAINFHAVAGLHDEAGRYRDEPVRVGEYIAPDAADVPLMMNEFLKTLKGSWWSQAVPLAAWALWRINHVHPFRNGNGRTARAVCYYVLCVKAGGLLVGQPIFPEMLRNDPVRSTYIAALKLADAGNISLLDRSGNPKLNEAQ